MAKVIYAEEITTLKKCGDTLIRRIFIQGNGKRKPAIRISNDCDAKAGVLIQKYSKRWLDSAELSDPIHFFT
jgi:hypothetical protein